MIGIYKITNQCNGQVYIGQSKNIEKRWKSHKSLVYQRNTQLYQAMRQFGIDNFLFEVIEECPLDQLNEREKFYIQQYDSLNTGYNMSVIENQQHKIDWDIAELIVKDLQETTLTGQEIAEKYDVSNCLVSQINHGKMWHLQNQPYPIREKKNRIATDTVEEEIEKEPWRCPATREELKALIRSTPFVQIGKMFNVSDNGIRRWCDKYLLPRTKREIKKYSNEEWELI